VSEAPRPAIIMTAPSINISLPREFLKIPFDFIVPSFGSFAVQGNSYYVLLFKNSM
jgi:hypothetical protein